MTILFEDYYYDAEAIGRILPEELLSWSADESRAKTSYVGYYYSDLSSEAIFILPKVFVDHENRPFGRDGLAFEDFLSPGKSLTQILGETDALTVSRLSFWLYGAISRYADRHPGTGILQNKDIQDIKSVGEYDTATLIEVIQSLRKFNRDHQNLFTFIARTNRSGAHNINWNRTVNKVLPFLQDEDPIYLNFINKKKSINFDEEIIVLFYSVLEYLKEKYFFEEPVNLNFHLLPTHEIDSLIEAGMGTLRMNKIRHKYFTDELVQLWNLLYVFFDKAERIANKGYVNEYVLACSFNNVFEDMIDQLIGSEEIESIKKNRDGKIIDHLYKDESIFNNGQVYYIADSKYYKESSDLSRTSVYKQFTYAKNIIQYNLDLGPKDKGYLPAMRDGLTEGYNVVPNFFIRGSATGKDGLYDYESDRLTNEFDTDKTNAENCLVSSHFPNRLFDRDTLVLQTYSINFLYVLAKYMEGGDIVTKERIRRKFRNDLIERFNNLYCFFKLVPRNEPLDVLVARHFKLLHGKVYCPDEKREYLVLALEKGNLTQSCCECTADFWDVIRADFYDTPFQLA